MPAMTTEAHNDNDRSTGPSDGMCDCGKFFLDWICGYDPNTGQCSLAGTEECDWECPRGI